ncbi:bifunctional 2-C-methyl-D-erythritol 4-phosphate cytidylyltransferase/2-C-methyl-D-erythritol 2,4-cyclodiphosphate synthase [Roseovarius spongiae]|uniref:Bifunctional enzyme IspD/IspF n=1 Tax=Roseovarius spongiae TaxID=2320272 RepID=A0A3A8B5P8_9RHOB|nr:bifunctional 2-C-methyl-D-erythritol 4-phosphate cytidylyltransferase/2-C-methyl-D-erythritol 2,4-cyclodiphosphate synthase [Roseovarius spongiae]RKF15186.1 bifunctional 2-C-methyl-D-erythritol 4-phosphate cytidylyltransferase/2-C-methyl-D-erythritol 2,4-cyclodiphosphate synthase [Roseovarius spongiae]
MTHAAAIIVAAGRGLRAGGPVPKQWRPLAGRRVIDWTLERFAIHPRVGRIVLVLHPDDLAAWPEQPGIETVAGGDSRSASVRNGLDHLAGSDVANVLIHDVARPCLSEALIDAVLDALITRPAAAPALPVTDALWRGRDGRVAGAQDRAGLYRAQTPQGFDLKAILAAHRAHPGPADDDVAIARAAGLDVSIVPGEESNLKITHAPDFARAERILRAGGPAQKMDIRIGNGYDVHRFGPGDHVMLCGVAVPHHRGLQGHSDADVGLHALTDAIYGALAEGDIGRHFPPSEAEWKGAASDIFLRHAVELAASKGFEISNLDLTLVCERPKIGPYATAMRESVALITGVAPERVSVKATTSERLGFTGREEGIAAIATAALVKP